ncbi:hypothetical protein VKT23_013999 [Stygiomarasmius scandens]|uniref:Uncharacterized protein n=1 Tax=Marasmiellus scandens TaxID=2682957 RepID=A0ABR1J1N0_9AGAR
MEAAENISGVNDAFQGMVFMAGQEDRTDTRNIQGRSIVDDRSGNLIESLVQTYENPAIPLQHVNRSEEESVATVYPPSTDTDSYQRKHVHFHHRDMKMSDEEDITGESASFPTMIHGTNRFRPNVIPEYTAPLSKRYEHSYIQLSPNPDGGHYEQPI